MALMRIKARWTVPGAGTAFSVFHFGDDGDSDISSVDATAAVNATRTFFDAIKAYLPSPVSVQVLGDVEHIDVATGDLVNVVSGGSPTIVNGAASSAATWAAPAGACITWSTNGIRTVSSKPRRVRGRTFIVPLSSTAFASDGTIETGALAAMNTAANNLRSPLSGYFLQVYGRPDDVLQVVGQTYGVTGSRITDQAAILRSRRA